jgi:hypothetical protein
MSSPRHARRPPPGRRLPTLGVLATVLAGVALVTAGTAQLLHGSNPTVETPATAAAVGPQAATQATEPPSGPRLTGSKRVTAHAGRVTVVTTLRLDGQGTVALRVPRHAAIHGLSQLRVERVNGPQMHPISGAFALRSGDVLRLRGSYRWHGCPRRGPQVWPQPFALPASVRVHWHRIDVPRHSRQAVCR